MIKHILFSSNEAFKLREFMFRAERHLNVPFDLIVVADDEKIESPHVRSDFWENRKAYDKVISELELDSSCSSIHFLKDTSLSDLVGGLLSDHGPDDLVCFLTTDEMLVDVVDQKTIEETFKEKMLFSFSLRLGKNIDMNSMVGMANLVVPTVDDGNIIIWDWDKHYVDFSGPLSVHGHYYRTKEIYRMVKKTKAWSYDMLEDELQAFMNFPKKLMGSFIQSKAYSIDPLLHGTHREDVHAVVNERLISNDPFQIAVPKTHNEIHINPYQDIMKDLYGWQRQRVLFKFPARGRKEKLLSTLSAYHENLINKEDFEFLLSIDDDDAELNNDETKELLSKFPNTKVVVGPSIGKIGAVNRDMDDAQPWDIVVLLSDDMMPKLKGFDMIIRKDMNKHFPDKDGVLWYNDGHQREKLNTLCILGKKYYDRFGWIYHPGYKSLFCLAPETKICMANHTMKAISEIEIGDIVVGSEKRHPAKGKSKCKLEYLTPSKVTAIHKREAPIIKITLQSGTTIRCTPDHIWAYYSGDRKYLYDNRSSNHKKSTYEYGVATDDMLLVRAVKFPDERELEKYSKEVGWLAGMFDGEGSFPCISQSLTHNPEVCAEIERVMLLLGFELRIGDYKHKGGSTQRHFYLSGGRDNYFRFLSLLKPIRNNTKQVNKRMFCARFGQPDRIVSIQEDGFGTVHCITTESGNFIANGYLSHNCDNDFMEVSKRLGKVQYNSLCIIEHQHWVWGYGDMDDLYKTNEKYFEEDRTFYHQRLAENFGITA